MGRLSLLTIVYLVIGVVVAATRDYLGDIDGLRGLLSAGLAILLWPLVLLGIDLELGRDGGRGSLLVPVPPPFWPRAGRGSAAAGTGGGRLKDGV